MSPPGTSSGGAPEGSLRLAGGPLAFSSCEVIWREGEAITRRVASLGDIAAWSRADDDAGAGRAGARLERLTAPRPSLLGLPTDRPLIMGVVNVTPDSFSDGGRAAEPAAAIALGRALAAAGADIVDVGGESTRPGADPVPAELQCARVLPVIRALAGEGVRVSIDTRLGSVMAQALEAGAAMVNDTSALAFDAASLSTVARRAAPVVLMHMQGTPKTMQVAPRYRSAPLDVFDYLEGRIEACLAAGLERSRLVVDPGIGFGKTAEHNLEILRNLALFHGLGCLLLLGLSRKSFIAKLSAGEPAEERLAGSLAAALFALAQGVQILRVHDVAETRQAIAVWTALQQ